MTLRAQPRNIADRTARQMLRLGVHIDNQIGGNNSNLITCMKHAQSHTARRSLASDHTYRVAQLRNKKERPCPKRFAGVLAKEIIDFLRTPTGVIVNLPICPQDAPATLVVSPPPHPPRHPNGHQGGESDPECPPE